ncbi:MAG: ABC-F family ATP-binding cassette domain-containing protein [Thermodesulfobacteriota bacterium]
MIKAVNISKSFGAEALLDDISFDINKGERVGLVGRNGHGKTTLLRILAGKEAPDSGAIAVPRGYRIGYVTQHIHFTQPTVLEEACTGLPRAHAHDTWRAEKILSGLGFSKTDMNRDPADFSGGYQVRLNLTKVICAEPDLLLLDEPTNYLDIVSIRWLSSFLRQWPGEVLLITHDRSFMDGVITHTLGIHRKKIRKMTGATDKYYDQILKEEEIHEKTRINEEKKRKEAELFISRFRAKARLAGLVQSRIKTLEKQEVKDPLEKIKTLDFSFSHAPTPAKMVLQAENLGFGYAGGPPLVDGLNFAVNRNDRICVIGKNGRGKTTLLRLIAGDLTPDRGRVSSHPATKIGYFAQTNKMDLNDSLTVEEEIMNAGCKRQQARNICGLMMFEGDQALKPVGVLSGGEKSRVLLGKILAAPSNLLLLDEPTNHLDMESCDAFLDAVNEFPGAVIIVTHNEMFLHTLANRLIVFQAGGASLFEGTYQDFLDRVGWEEESSRAGGRRADRSREDGLSKKDLRKQKADQLARRAALIGPLKKRMAEVEKAIEKGEAAIDRLNTDMVTASHAGDRDAIARFSREYHETSEKVNRLYDELDTLTTDLEKKSRELDIQDS